MNEGATRLTHVDLELPQALPNAVIPAKAGIHVSAFTLVRGSRIKSGMTAHGERARRWEAGNCTGHGRFRWLSRIGVLYALASFCYGCSGDYDDELIQSLESNRSEFEELVTLAPFCQHLYMSPGWVRPEFNHELESREEKRCAELFEALNIKSVLVYERGMRGASSPTVRLST
ncbi:MAG: hypothetical protein AAF170_19855, partial [Bacteroidota bacterium]